MIRCVISFNDLASKECQQDLAYCKNCDCCAAETITYLYLNIIAMHAIGRVVGTGHDFDMI